MSVPNGRKVKLLAKISKRCSDWHRSWPEGANLPKVGGRRSRHHHESRLLSRVLEVEDPITSSALVQSDTLV